MKPFDFPKTRMLTPTDGERLTARPEVVFFLFFLVYSISNTLGTFLFRGLVALAPLVCPNRLNYATAVLLQLFSTAAMLVGVLLFCRLAERRSLCSLGFTRRGAVWEYGIGLLGGLGLFGSAVLLCVLTKTLTIQISPERTSPGFLALFLLGFLIQGMAEEVLCRSYLMVSLSRGWPVWVCALLNSLLFSILHLGNDNVSVIALVNIFLFGMFASMLTLRRGSIWMAGAVHSMWNFAQGNLFGIPVSGIQGLPSPLSSRLESGTLRELLNGGAFGLEGGLSVTVVLLAGCAVILAAPTKRSERVDRDL